MNDDGDEPERTSQDLLRYVSELGATEAESSAAAMLGGLRPLALDLSLRPPGLAISFEEFVADAGNEASLVRRLWLACGLPENPDFPFPVTRDAAAAIGLLAGLGQIVGEDAVMGFARALGSSIAHMAEALSEAMRLGVEVRASEEGASDFEMVRGYTSVARETLPGIANAIEALLRRHLVLVSYQLGSTDEDRTW